MSERKRPMRPRPVDIMSVTMSDEEEQDDPPARKPRGAPPPPSSTISTPTAFGLTDTQLHHLLLAKGQVAVPLPPASCAVFNADFPWGCKRRRWARPGA